MKNLFIILLLSSFVLHGQNKKIAFISNIESGNNDNLQKLSVLIDSLNNISGIDHLIITGNLSYTSDENDYILLNELLNSLKIPYSILPGENENKNYAYDWANYFDKIEGDNLLIETSDFLITAINGYLPYSDYEHFSIENLSWLGSTLKENVRNRSIISILPFSLSDGISNEGGYLSIIKSNKIGLIIQPTQGKSSNEIIDRVRVVSLQEGFFDSKGNIYYHLMSLNGNFISISKITLDGSEDKLETIDLSVDISTSEKQTPDIGNRLSNALLKIETNTSTHSRPLRTKERIFTFSEEGIISCYDTTGTQKWDYDSYGNSLSSPVIENGIVTIANLNGDLSSISQLDGEQIQTIGFSEPIITDLLTIEYKGNKELMIPKLNKSNTAIVFGSISGKLSCYDLETLQEYWVNTSAKGLILNRPLNADNKIFFTSRDGFLYSIDSRSGLMIWKWRESNNNEVTDGSPISDGKKIFVLSKDGTLSGIDLLLGKTEWKLNKRNIFDKIALSQDNKYIYAKSDSNKFLVINCDKGTIIKEIKLNFNLDKFPSDILQNENAIYFASGKSLYSIDNKYKVTQILSNENGVINYLELFNKKIMISDLNGRITIINEP
ncbi:MAG: PQQ-binding-like beta-propeller repeat protein [Melioribacteraceae bacterium]|nr:PQQ-binding-like beta-propeller repeat protein [Melioribacteraceae bacterium]